MKEIVKVTIHLFTNEFISSPNVNFNEFSTVEDIKVTVAEDGYSVLYWEGIFSDMNKSDFIKSLILLFKENLPDQIPEIRLKYHYIDIEYTTPHIVESLVRFVEFMNSVNQHTDDFIWVYEGSLNKFFDEYIHTQDEDADEDEDDDSEDDYNDIEDEEDDDSIWGDDLLNMIYGIKSDSSSDEEDDYRPYRYTYKSKVLRRSKDPRKMYYRHGVMVCNDKSAIKRDEKVIKEFLKDFIPGNSKWKKKFRRDLLERWMKMYVVSNKQLKSLEKQYRNNTRREPIIDTNKVLDVTRRLFNTSNDIWNDPNR